jgi:hypothetical protein
MPVQVFANVPPLKRGHLGASQSPINPQHDDGFVSCSRDGVSGQDRMSSSTSPQSRWAAGGFVAFMVAVSLPVDLLNGHLEGFGSEGVGAYLSLIF